MCEGKLRLESLRRGISGVGIGLGRECSVGGMGKEVRGGGGGIDCAGAGGGGGRVVMGAGARG